MNQKICIIGCGWLGFKLAKKLLKTGYQIHGTTTSKDKISTLESANITAFLINFSSDGIEGDIKTCLANCQTAIVNIPPGLRKNPEHDYVKKMMYLVEQIEKSSITQVVFIGSTSVYDDDENYSIINENSRTSNSKTALQLLEVESLFRGNQNFDTTILRCSGLFAEDRHPATFLSGRTNLKNGDAPVNLIHRDDCISIIIAILQQHLWNAVLNASTTPHPSKKDYYTSVCKSLRIPIPEFNTYEVSKGKIIDSKRLVQLLNYSFKVKL